MTDTFFSRLHPGIQIEIGDYEFEAEAIKRFARQFDPQPFHLDEKAAEASHFGRLCASGWHTCSIFMRLYVMNGKKALADAIGWGGPLPEWGPSPGIRDVKWLRPTYVGDTISYRSSMREARLSRSRVGWGIVRSDVEATNQNGETVLRFLSSGFIRSE